MNFTLHIKNMVCPRCIETVEQLLSEKRFRVVSIKLGEAEIDKELTTEQISEVAVALKNRGFELLTDKKSRMVDQVKSEIIKLIHHSENEILNVNLSTHLSHIIGTDYSTVSNLFSSSVGITIEKFTILQKIEKIKELLSYDELTTNEIACKMGYSSAAYLSSQFKKETGLTPGQYKNLKEKERKPLDEVGK